MRAFVRAGILVVATVALAPRARAAHPAFSSLEVHLFEAFEDGNVVARGWYDNTTVAISSAEHIPGSTASVEYRFLPGARTPTSGGGMRHKFPASDRVYLSYWVKYSASWEGSNRPYHPHEFQFTTTMDSDWVGPAFTHLTTYIEQNEGRPLVAIQDGRNIDQAQIRVDLTQVTENRAVAGCNGDSDGWGLGDCYLNGSVHWNGKAWRAPQVYFSDLPGPYDKNDWHFVEAYFEMNSIAGGKGVADGRVAYWYDGVPVIDARRVMLRTAASATMQFSQLLIAPYIGDGSPVDQTMWVDDLRVATPGVSLLRNDEIAALAAARVAMAAILVGGGDVTLDEFGPDDAAGAGEGALESGNGSSDDDDFYVASVVPGMRDPDPVAVVPDARRPLVLWQVSERDERLMLVKDGSGSVALFW